MLLAGVFAAPLLGLMNAPPEVLPLAVPLLQLMAPAVLLDAWNSTAASVLRSHLHARPTMVVNLAMQACAPGAGRAADGRAGQLGRLGPGRLCPGPAGGARPGAGAVPAGLATPAGRCVPRRADWWQWRRQALAPVLHIGLPGAAENVAWRTAYVFSISVVGSMGTLALATHAYTMQLIHFLLLPAATLGLAAEIMVGHLVGAGRLHEANQLVRRLLVRGLLMALAVSLLAALAGRWLMGWFTADAQIIASGALLLWLTIALETGRSFNLVLVNALAGGRRRPLPGAGGRAVLCAGDGRRQLAAGRAPGLGPGGRVDRLCRRRMGARPASTGGAGAGWAGCRTHARPTGACASADGPVKRPHQAKSNEGRLGKTTDGIALKRTRMITCSD